MGIFRKRRPCIHKLSGLIMICLVNVRILFYKLLIKTCSSNKIADAQDFIGGMGLLCNSREYSAVVDGGLRGAGRGVQGLLSWGYSSECRETSR